MNNASLWDMLLVQCPTYVWAYNGPMEIVNFPPNYEQIGASGVCPHCAVRSYFKPLTSYREQIASTHAVNIVSAAQCESCKNFALAIGFKEGQQGPCSLISFFPLGKPQDQVDPNVPHGIAVDFKEALRCEWVEAYKACVVMCRRVIQASAVALGARGVRLIDQIDDLFSKGKITEPLKDFAHEVRLVGNVGAHPDKDGLDDVEKKDAGDIVELTREYLHHVYVMPAKLNARKRPPSGATPPATQ